jgi:hypothetical protein
MRKILKEENYKGFNLRVEVLTEKISDEKVDSFWYHNDEIALVQLPSGTKLYAESRGEIAVAFEENGTYYKGGQAVEKAVELEYNDTDLTNLMINDLCRNNNWFVVVKVDINGETISDDLAIGGDYEEIINLLVEVAKEEYDIEYH